MKTIAFATAFAALLLGGCATHHYGCPVPDGVTCMSATEVYNATAHSDRVVGKAAPRPASGSRSNEAGQGRGIVVIDNGSLTLADGPTPVERLPAEVPLRSPARVMRIWFSPWEDAAGDLHMAGHLFTEIEPRRWTVAEKAPSTQMGLQLLEPLSAPAASKSESQGSSPEQTPPPSGRTERPATTSMTENPTHSN